MKNKKLRLAILDVFNNETECALTLSRRFPERHWSKAKLNKISLGKTTINVYEANDLAKVLNKTVEEIANFFI